VERGARPSPLVSRTRAEARWPGRTRLHLVREHWHRMRLGVTDWRQRENEVEVQRYQRAMAWAERELGLR
jgi:hypothetical protein